MTNYTVTRASPDKLQDPDYSELREILENQLNRPVSLEEAVGTGKFLINVYDILLSDDQYGATIKTDTT